MEKESISKEAEAAVERFARGFNCSQSVFAAFAARFGMDEATALKLTSPLGGGIARRGEICGAVSGALLALGLARGTDTPLGKEDSYRLGQEFLQHFEKKHGTILCRELIDCDISTPAGRQKGKARGVFTALCPLFVEDAAQIVNGMLQKE
jgi:C_GCAxxG_C_C family probable redox protein